MVVSEEEKGGLPPLCKKTSQEDRSGEKIFLLVLGEFINYNLDKVNSNELLISLLIPNQSLREAS